MLISKTQIAFPDPSDTEITMTEDDPIPAGANEEAKEEEDPQPLNQVFEIEIEEPNLPISSDAQVIEKEGDQGPFEIAPNG